MMSLNHPAPGPPRLADLLPTGQDLTAHFGPLDPLGLGDGDGCALTLEEAALAEGDPAAELARLRTRHYRRGWERSWQTSNGWLLDATAYEFASERDAALSVEDQWQALRAGAARPLILPGTARHVRVCEVTTIDPDPATPMRSIIVLCACGHTSVQCHLLAPDSDIGPSVRSYARVLGELIATAVERWRSMTAANRSSTASS